MSMFCNVIMLLLVYVHVRVTRTGWKTRPRPKTVILSIKKSNQIKSSQERDIQQGLTDNMSEVHLSQIHNQPNRLSAILDLVFTTKPTLLKTSTSIPGIQVLHPQHKGEVELPLYSQQHDLEACDQQSLLRHPLLPRPEVGRPHCQDLQES